ncbi:hypothetical protein [Cellulophaga sp. L1A9]|uniref:hypothetical protein n=1 Tax=Cellulophaga sp. L1A9 TaxID=2686362 RepID=UPI00131D0898|nr:hypothetical protein [Cellulophaga sp. L1A9]
MAHGSLSQFKATLARKIERDQKRQSRAVRNSDYKDSDEKPEYNFPELTEKELEKVKSDIRKKLKADRKKEYIYISIAFVVIVVLVLVII